MVCYRVLTTLCAAAPAAALLLLSSTWSFDKLVPEANFPAPSIQALQTLCCAHGGHCVGVYSFIFCSKLHRQRIF